MTNLCRSTSSMIGQDIKRKIDEEVKRLAGEFLDIDPDSINVGNSKEIRKLLEKEGLEIVIVEELQSPLVPIGSEIPLPKISIEVRHLN